MLRNLRGEQSVDGSMDYGAIQRMVHGGAPKRKVRPLHRVNSAGQVCGLGFYTESGRNLASLTARAASPSME